MPIRMIACKKDTGLDKLDKEYLLLRNAITDKRGDKYISWRIKSLNNCILMLYKGTYPLNEKIKEVK